MGASQRVHASQLIAVYRRLLTHLVHPAYSCQLAQGNDARRICAIAPRLPCCCLTFDQARDVTFELKSSETASHRATGRAYSDAAADAHLL